MMGTRRSLLCSTALCGVKNVNLLVRKVSWPSHILAPIQSIKFHYIIPVAHPGKVQGNASGVQKPKVSAALWPFIFFIAASSSFCWKGGSCGSCSGTGATPVPAYSFCNSFANSSGCGWVVRAFPWSLVGKSRSSSSERIPRLDGKPIRRAHRAIETHHQHVVQTYRSLHAPNTNSP